MQGIRRDQITFTRFVAALGIVVFHYGANAFPFGLAAVAPVFRNANLAVSYFFTLSGFIMVLAYSGSARIEPRAYWRSRIARIAPAYYFALALFLPFIVLRWAQTDHLGLALNLALLQAWVPTEALAINPPGWSLSVEVLFYALFPFLFNRLYRTQRLGSLAAGAAVLFVASQLLHQVLLQSDFHRSAPAASHDLIYYFPLMHLNEFVLGNVAGLLFMQRLAGRSRPNGPWILLAVLALLAALVFPIGLSMHNGLLAIVFVPLILLIASDNGALSRLMARQPLVYLGEISFGIYILQMPVFALSYAPLKVLGVADPTLFFFAYLAILLTAAALSHRFIETPLRRRINGARRAPAAGGSTA